MHTTSLERREYMHTESLETRYELISAVISWNQAQTFRHMFPWIRCSAKGSQIIRWTCADLSPINHVKPEPLGMCSIRCSPKGPHLNNWTCAVFPYTALKRTDLSTMHYIILYLYVGLHAQWTRCSPKGSHLIHWTSVVLCFPVFDGNLRVTYLVATRVVIRCGASYLRICLGYPCMCLCTETSSKYNASYPCMYVPGYWSRTGVSTLLVNRETRSGVVVFIPDWLL